MGYHKQRSLPSKKTSRAPAKRRRARSQVGPKGQRYTSKNGWLWTWSTKLQRYLSPLERKDGKKVYRKSGPD